MIKLDTLQIMLTLRCPACKKIHKWKQKDAWVEGTATQGVSSPKFSN
jgi:phage FluMu protein Com